MRCWQRRKISMSRRDDTVPMRHMLDYAREAVALVRQRSRADLDADRLLQLGLRQIIQVVGEAANRVSRDGQARYPDIPWRDAIAARNRRPGARPPWTRELMPGTIDQLLINRPKCRHRGQRIWRSRGRLPPMNSYIGFAVLVLAGALLATPARAQTFQVDAERNGATIIRRPCDGGPCCNTCHVGQPAPDKKPPKHDRALYSKHLVQLAEGKRLTVSRDSYVVREKGELVLYEGK